MASWRGQWGTSVQWYPAGYKWRAWEHQLTPRAVKRVLRWTLLVAVPAATAAAAAGDVGLEMRQRRRRRDGQRRSGCEPIGARLLMTAHSYAPCAVPLRRRRRRLSPLTCVENRRERRSSVLASIIAASIAVNSLLHLRTLDCAALRAIYIHTHTIVLFYLLCMHFWHRLTSSILTAVGRSVCRQRSLPGKRRQYNADDADVAGTYGWLWGRDGGVANGQHASARPAGHVAVSCRLRQPSQDAIVAV